MRTLPCLTTNVSSDPDGIQTHDLQIRNLTLYSAELPGPIPLYVAKVDNSLDISSQFIPKCRAIAIETTLTYPLSHGLRPRVPETPPQNRGSQSH